MKTLRFFAGLSMLLGMISSALPVAAVSAPAAQPVPVSTELFPTWASQPPAAQPAAPVPAVLPAWFEATPLPTDGMARGNPSPNDVGLHSITSTNLRVDGPATANVCDTLTYTVYFTNSATPATNVQLVSAMPYPYSPSPQSCGPFNMGPNEARSCTFAFAGGCAAVSGQNVVTLTQDGGPTIVRYTDLVVNPGAITVRKEPAVIPAALGDVVTWTVFVENTGYGNVSNVVLTDVLGSGLAYVSGLTTAYIPSMTVGQVLTFPVSAQVVGCSNLKNVVTGTWGCNGTTCLLPQTATAAIDLQMRNPNLAYSLPTFNIPYCTGEQVFTIPLTNSGDGTAYSVTLTTDLSPFDVTTDPGVSYSGGVFSIPPIAPGETYNLVFTLTLPASPCAMPTSGSFNFNLLYYDICRNPYYTLPQNAAWQLTDIPGDISLSKSMPAEVYLGDTVTATIDVDLSGIIGTVIVTDTLPPGWTVIDTDGGISFTLGGTTYITWEVSASDSFTIILRTPDANAGGCDYCGTQMTNVVIARGTDCQDCVHEATASASTYVQCDEGVSSDKQVSAPLVPCSESTYFYTNTYTFDSSFAVTPTWGGLVFTETLPYQIYVTGTAWVWVSDGITGCLATFSEAVVNGMLVISGIAVPCGVDLPGATMQIGYQTRVGEPSACSDARWYDWSYLNLGVTGNGACAADGVLEEGVFVETRAPQMRLSLSGLPPVVSSCGAYTVTLTAERTTPDIAAYNAAVDLITDTYAVITVLGYGGATPISVTTDITGYHWHYGDAFTSALTATIELLVQLRCTQAAPFEARLHYDNRCGSTCYAGGTLGNPLVAPCAPILTKFPEVIYATSDFVHWTLTVFNSGAGPAYNVTLTDTLGSGLRYVGSTITSTQGSVVGVTPITSAHHVTWTLPVIQPKEKVIISYDAEVIGCDDLTNVFAGRQGCLGKSCLQGCAATSRVELPPTILLNTNQFVSPIDTCYTRTVTVTVRNAGLLSVYSATVTEILPPGLYYVPATTEVSTDTINWQAGPDPTIVGQQLFWGPSGPPLDSWLARIRPYETVYIRFQTTASCPFNGGQIRVRTAYLDPCGTPHLTQASTYLMQARAPALTFIKVGQHLTRTHPSPELVYAEPGETVEWTITVANAAGASPATNVVVTDTLPYNAGFLAATPGYGLSAPAPGTLGGVVSWTIGLVNPGETIVLTVTSVVSQPEGCDPVDTRNLAHLTWGCDDGCRVALQDDAYLRTVPVFEAIGLSADAGPRTLNQCGGVLTITLFNDGPPAYNVVLTDTLPLGFVYSDTIAASTWPVTITNLGQIVVYNWSVLPSGSSTITFRVRNAQGSGSNCTMPYGNNLIEVLYDDDVPDCLTSGPYTESVSYGITVVGPVLSISKTPPNQTVNVGEPVTWTLTVQNVGTGVAYNLVVTDVAGTSYVNVNATVGSDGAVPIIAGNTITWYPNPLPAGGTWTAQVTAVLTDTGDNVNRAWVRGGCDTGCVSSRDDDDAHTTLLQAFAKTPEVQTGTIGSLVVFYLEATLTDWDALYENLTLTDTLPAGLGYVSAVLTYTYDADGSDNGPFGPFAIPPTSAPTPPGSGNVVWMLGNVSGTIQINAVITTVILDIPANYSGVRLTNRLRMTYTDDGVPYQYQDEAYVDILEPLLHLGKTYVTPSGCRATLLEENFNDGVANGWVAGSGTWSITQGEYRTSSNNASRFAGDTSWTDYSFSAMLRSDATGTARSRPGLYLRYTNANNYLRLYWTSNTNLRFEQRVGGTTTQLQNYNYPLTTNRWYHFEVQVVGNVASIWIDGIALPLGPVTFSAALSTGRIGLHNSYASGTGTAVSRFDDILVTRLGRMACTVGANDLVTYTLTISNQAQIPAYDLVITDIIPAGMSLFTYTMTSSDPTAAVVSEPAPIPGATGTLIWQVNHLTPTVPFNPLNHTYLKLNVVLQVSDGITANIVLANQAFLFYDGQEGNGPLNIERDYSGGSHSTAVRTVNGGIAKRVAFSPPPTATLGTVIVYTLIVPDPPISATLYNVAIADTLDGRLAIQSVAFSGGTGGAAGWSGQTVTATFASIPHHTQAIITVTAVISDPLGAVAGDLITNSAQMIHATSPVTTSNEVSVNVGEPLLTLVKASDPPTSSTVGAGDIITYEVTITNIGDPAGPAPAYDIVFTDTLPGYANDLAPTLLDITLDSSPVNPALYTASYAAGVYTIVFAPTFAFSIPVGSALVIRYAATVDADVGVGLDLTNAAEVTWSSLPGPTSGDRDYGPIDDDTTVHTVQPTIVKAVIPPTATIGTIITYTIRLPEPPITATIYNAVVTDALSPWLELLFVDAPGSNTVVSDTTSFSVTYALIPAGEQRIITVTAVVVSTAPLPPWEPIAGDLITNIVTLSHDTGITTSNEVTVTVVEPELVIVKASDPPQSSTVAAGQAVTYTVLITNIGDSPAYRYTFEDQLPPGMQTIIPTLLSITIDGTPVPAGNYALWLAPGTVLISFENWAPLPPGAVLEIVYVAYVDEDVAAGVDLTNVASVDWMSWPPGGQTEVRYYPPISTTNTVHAGYPALDLEKTADPSPVEAGGLLTYTLTVINNGLVSATSVVVSDAVPLNTVYQSCGPLPCGEASGVVSWTLGTLNVGEMRILTMLVRVDSPLLNGTVLTNTAWLTSGEGITDTDEITTPVESWHTLAITKTAAPDPVEAGGLLTYTLSWAVSGNEPALGVTISDTVPAHTSYVSCAGASCGEAGGLVTWSLGDIDPPAAGSVTLVVLVDSPLLSGTVIANAALISDTQGITDTDDTTTPVESWHTLAITKTAAPDPVAAGSLLTYTLSWEVSGNEPALGVTISDTVPAHTGYHSCAGAPCSEASGIVTWNLGDIDPPAAGSVTLVVLVDSPLLTGTVIANAALISDMQGITDTDEITTPVESWHTLTIIKTAAPDPVEAGGLLTYTLSWAVSGNEPALDVTISDTVPAHTSYVLCAGAPCSEAGGLVTWSLGDIDPPAAGSVTLIVLVDSPLLSGTVIANAALISDTQGITDTDDTTTPVESWHTLAITKTAAPDPVAAGSLLTYTLSWEVSGNEPALGVTISDAVPAHTGYHSCAGAPCSEASGIVTWNLGDIDPPAAGIVTLVVLVDSTAPSGTLLMNVASITDTQGITDTDDTTTPVETGADLSVVKSDNPDPVIVGTLLTYTLRVTNYGPSAAENVIVTDTLPAEVAYVSAVPAHTYIAPDTVVWNLGTLLPDETQALTVVVQVHSWVTQTFANAVVVGSETPDPDPTDNSDDEPTTPLVPGLTVDKTVLPGEAVPNAPFIYVIVITNTGQVRLDLVALTDTLPSLDFHYVAGSATPSEPTINPPQLIWPNLGALDPGDSLTVTFAVTVTPGVTGTFLNVALAAGQHPGGVITDTDDVPVSIQDPAVAIAKHLVGFDTDIWAPNYVTFTIVITNVGISTLDILPLYDVYDANYIHFAYSFPVTPDTVDNVSGQAVWLDLTGPAPHGFGHNLLPGEVFSLTTVFTVVQNITTPITNTAIVSDVIDVYDNPTPPDKDDEPIVNIPTAVTLRYFRAVGQERSVRLEWATAVEIDNFGFRLYRAPAPVWAQAEELAFVPSACRGSFCGAEYVYTDRDIVSGVAYWYWLIDVDTSGVETRHGPVSAQSGLASTAYKLYLPLLLRLAR